MIGALDSEVEAALKAEGWRWSGWECLSSFVSLALDRVTYRVDLDGAGPATVKARRMPGEGAARVQAEIRRELPEAFVAVLARHGRVLLEEWVDGEVLGADPDAARLREAADLLAALHLRTTLDGRSMLGRESTAAQRDKTLQALRRVRGAGLLQPGQASALARTLRRTDPGSCLYGLVHTDFCGVNMVVERSGLLRVVDNERLGRDALGYDLGRSWYRWGLAPESWRCFLDAYSAALPAREPRESSRFWQIVAAVRAVEIRLHHAPDQVGAPLACLRGLMEDVAA